MEVNLQFLMREANVGLSSVLELNVAGALVIVRDGSIAKEGLRAEAIILMWGILI